MLCDSNILIYAADPDDTCCAAYAERVDAAIASVSRIEVLGFPGFAQLSPDQQKRLEELVGSLVELALDDRVAQCAIALRRQRKMSLADAVIAATALEHGLPLVTRNIGDFKQVTGLTLVDPFAATR